MYQPSSVLDESSTTPLSSMGHGTQEGSERTTEDYDYLSDEEMIKNYMQSLAAKNEETEMQKLRNMMPLRSHWVALRSFLRRNTGKSIRLPQKEDVFASKSVSRWTLRFGEVFVII